MKDQMKHVLTVLLTFPCLLPPASAADRSPPDRRVLAFVQAVSADDTNTVRELIAAGVDVNERFGSLNETALFRAAMWGRIEVAKLLIESGADALATNKWGSTPFHVAAARGHKALAKVLLARGAKFDAPDALGRTPLFMAAKEGSEEAALWLLELGADPNIQPKDSSKTVVYQAAFNGESKLLRALEKRGARLDGIGPEGWTPLHAAVMRGDANSVEALLQAGAAVDQTDKRGLTPLLLGVHQGQGNQAAIVDLLVQSGADLTKTDKHGRSALDLAQQRRNKAERQTDEPEVRRTAEITRVDATLSRIKHYQDRSSKTLPNE